MRARDRVADEPAPAPAPPVARTGPGLAAAGNRALASLYTGGEVADAPVKSYIGPFDRTPLVAPGERLIFEGKFTDPAPADYQVEFASGMGNFTTVDGPSRVVFPGLDSGNVDFFVPSLWDGTGPLQVVLRVRRLADNVSVRTETWTLGLKKRLPTTMTQREGAGEQALPGHYHYRIGPPLLVATPPHYEHQTILERFSGWHLADVAPADIAEPYRRDHGLTSADAVSRHFLPEYRGSNGTFTVDHDDEITDRHSGHPDLSALVAALAAPKPVEVALPQVYEAAPGVPLGNYVVTRILQADGSTWKVRKG